MKTKSGKRKSPAANSRSKKKIHFDKDESAPNSTIQSEKYYDQNDSGSTEKTKEMANLVDQQNLSQKCVDESNNCIVVPPGSTSEPLIQGNKSEESIPIDKSMQGHESGLGNFANSWDVTSKFKLK